MKIHELLSEANNIVSEITLPDFRKDVAGRGENSAEKKLTNWGYEKVGSGTYADVYTKPGTDKVLKVFDDEDRGYLQFIRFIKKNPNPHYPVFLSKLTKVSDWIYAIRIEKLTPIGGNYHGASKQDLSETLRRMTRFNNWDEMIADAAAREGENNQPEIIELLKYFQKTQPGLLDAVRLLYSNAKKKTDVDLHDENIMLRGDTIVISDPWVVW
jgi:hypothetical protein